MKEIIVTVRILSRFTKKEFRIRYSLRFWQVFSPGLRCRFRLEQGIRSGLTLGLGSGLDKGLGQAPGVGSGLNKDSGRG